MRGLITEKELLDSICTKEEVREIRIWYIFYEFFFALIIYRLDKGFTRSQMADILEMSHYEYEKMEDGEFENMTLHEFSKILEKINAKIIFKLDKNIL